MATGEVQSQANCKKSIVLCEDVISANGEPSPGDETVGVSMYETSRLGQEHADFEDGACFPRQPAANQRLMLKGPTGITAMTIALWGYLKHAGDWFKVKVNAGAAITSFENYTEVVQLMSAFDRAYLEVEAVTGAAAAVKASLDTDPLATNLDSIFEARVGGTAGNSITLAFVADSPPAGGVTVTEVGNAVTVHFETAVSTVADAEAAVDANSTLIVTKTPGTGVSVLAIVADDFPATALTGGVAIIGVSAYLVACQEAF